MRMRRLAVYKVAKKVKPALRNLYEKKSVNCLNPEMHLTSHQKNSQMKKNVVFVLVLTLLAGSALHAQRVIIGVGPRFGYGYRPPYRSYPQRRAPQENRNLPKFEPQMILSFGYGFPNVDKNYLIKFRDYYQGNLSQMGPLSASLDYRFSRSMSIGALVTHGTVSAPYYNYSSGVKSFTGNINNWAFMLNLVHYIPVDSKVTPYLRGAIGINSWKQDYADASGSKVVLPDALPDLAYQVGLGAQIGLSRNSGIFLEAGYGKYILHGGLTFKF